MLNSIEARAVAYHLHSYSNPQALIETGLLVIEHGEGIYVCDNSGNRYIDGVASLWYAWRPHLQGGPRPRPCPMAIFWASPSACATKAEVDEIMFIAEAAVYQVLGEQSCAKPFEPIRSAW
jgi:adenosylmethionine-8-amino-7-oxononanoate aminotransferase